MKREPGERKEKKVGEGNEKRARNRKKKRAGTCAYVITTKFRTRDGHKKYLYTRTKPE